MNEDLKELTELDRLIHEPARLLIVSILYPVEKVDFLFLLHETGLTKGNLSAHLSRLEEAGYVIIEKTFRGKVPQTLISETPTGREAFENYRQKMQIIMKHLSQE
jgi:DNA-binding MarR family transcriptional regulator